MCVSLLREDILASYTLRTFSVRYMKPNGTVSKKEMTTLERTVYQYHFTAWPDHGVPLHALPLVSFVRNSAAANALDAGPIVVHCRYFFLIKVAFFHKLRFVFQISKPPKKIFQKTILNFKFKIPAQNSIMLWNFKLQVQDSFLEIGNHRLPFQFSIEICR